MITKIVVCIFLGISALITIWVIGEERKPIGKGQAVFNVALAATLIIGLLLDI